MSDPQPVVVAIDFTPEEVRLALAPLGGAPLLREAYPLPANVHDEAAWSWEIGGRISALFAHEGQRRSALGIAVACPGEVDEATGRLTRCPGRPEWDGLAVVDAVRRHIDAPVVALNRAHAALRGESEHGAAAEATDAIYLSLRGTPTAAVKTASRIVSGARGSAGALADFPALEPGAAVPEEAIEEMAGLLSDLAAFLDPGVIVLDAEDAHLAAIGPALQRAVNAVATGPVVVASALGESAALLGALGAAAIVAYEGERSA